MGIPLPAEYSEVCVLNSESYYDYTKIALTEKEPTYRLGDYVDKGTFGRCFKGRKDNKTEYNYCIKVLKRHKETHIEKIQREVFILQKLQGGPAVVKYNELVHDPSCVMWRDRMKYFEIFEAEDYEAAKNLNVTKQPRHRIALVFEWVDATPWKTALKKLSNVDIQYFFFQLLVVLDYSHSKGIMHRDVKPPNCLLDLNEYRLVLIDWGQAEFFVPGKNRNCQVGGISYKAPELVFGGNLQMVMHDYAVDIWSFGAMLANSVLFDGQRDLFYGRTRDRLIESITMLLGTEDLVGYLDSRPEIRTSPLTDELRMNKPLTKRADLHIYQNNSNASRCTDDFYDVMNKCLQYDPRKRATPHELYMYHPYFVAARQEFQDLIPELDWSDVDRGDEGLSRIKTSLHKFLAR